MGVTEVKADLLTACFAKESWFPRNGEKKHTHTQHTLTNKHADSSLCLNTVRTYCKGPPTFCYTNVHTPTDAHVHYTHTHTE